MKYVCIDYGSKRVGLAVSDSDGSIAFPRTTLQNNTELLKVVTGFIKDEHVQSIVIGDTRTHGGAVNPVSEAADVFARNLSEAAGLPLERGSELWSTMEASKFAPKGHEHDDAVAAAFILQRFLDMRKKQ